MNFPQFRGIQLAEIPSHRGGSFPGAIVERNETDTTVICLDPLAYTNWVLTVPNKDIQPMSTALTYEAAQIIKSRLLKSN